MFLFVPFSSVWNSRAGGIFITFSSSFLLFDRQRGMDDAQLVGPSGGEFSPRKLFSAEKISVRIEGVGQRTRLVQLGK